MTNKGGRPTKLTPDIQVKLVQAIKAGNYFNVACEYVGIDYRTFRNWMKKGEESKSGQYFQFFHAIKKAEAEAETRMVAIWQNAMKDDWKAAATFLERKYPDRWGRKDKQEVTHNGSVEISGAKEKLVARINQIASRSRDSNDLP